MLIRNALDANQVQTYRDIIDDCFDSYRWSADHGVRLKRTILHHPAFVEFLTLPGILDRYNDIAGTAAVLKNSWAFRNPVRLPQEQEPLFPHGQADDGIHFHRGSSPTWAMHEDENQPGMHHFPYLNFFVYLSDVGKDNGGTLAFDGSHKVSGEFDRVSEHCEQMTVEARAGDIFLFTESLMHSGPLYFQHTRYCMVYTIVPCWYANQQDSSNPEWFYHHIDNDDLRGVLGEWRGVISPQRFGLDQPYPYDFSSPRKLKRHHFIKN